MMPVNPQRLMEAMVQAQKALAQLPPDADEKIRRDTIEGQSQAFEVMDDLAQDALSDKLLLERMEIRSKRLKTRMEQTRSTITQMITELGLTETLERPVYTLSVSFRQHVNIIDAVSIPAEFTTTTISPDKNKILRHLVIGEQIPGAVLSNPAPSITINSL